MLIVLTVLSDVPSFSAIPILIFFFSGKIFLHASEKNQSSRPNKPGRRALVERNSTPLCADWRLPRCGQDDAIINGHEADWVWKCDSDERADFAVAGGLRVVMQKAERLNADYVPGHWIDRVAPDQLLPAIKAGSTLADQFPIPALLTKYFQGSVDKKVALHRRTCPTGGANHEPHDKQKVPSPFQVPIWHFKWNSDCKQNQLTKIAADSHQLWIREWVQTISRFDEADGVLRGPWNGLPKAAWPRLPKKYGSGRYPFRTE